MTTFTPGPWTLGKGYKTARLHAVCADALVIAKVTGFGYPAGEGWSPQSEANARLIAAAPDLYAFTEEAADALNKAAVCLHANGAKQMSEAMFEMERAARAALAKAVQS